MATQAGHIVIHNSIRQNNFKYSFTKGRARTEKVILRPNVEKYNLFVDYYFNHKDYSLISYLRPYLFSSFPHRLTWDVDIKIVGKPLPEHYEIIANFMTDLQQFCLDLRFILDIYVWDIDDDIVSRVKEFNNALTSNTHDSLKHVVGFDRETQYFYYDHLTCEECGRVTSDLSKREGWDMEQVSENLWKFFVNRFNSKKWVKKGFMPVPVPMKKLCADYDYIRHKIKRKSPEGEK